MQLVCFSKHFADKDQRGLIEAAHALGLDGYDLCVRDGYVVNPGNAARELPALVRQLASEGLSVPMVTGPGNLVQPDDPVTQTLVAALGESGVPLLKIGYVLFDPKVPGSYREKESFLLRALEGWARLGEKHGVTVCYHTHSGPYVAFNAGTLRALLHAFNPRFIGGYLDTGHLRVSGEPFEMALQIVREHLAVVGLKDVRLVLGRNEDEGRVEPRWVTAGEGSVAWSEVFRALARAGFSGPLSIHAEFQVEDPAQFLPCLEREVAYFRGKHRQALSQEEQ